MSAVAAKVVLAGGVSVWRGGRPSVAHDTLIVGLLIAAMAALCVAISIYLRRRDRQPKPIADEWRARAVMGELCAHGWRAHIRLYGWGVPVPEDAPPSRTPLVELEWQQLEQDSGHVVVARRVWAPSIAQALQAMVDDCRTTLKLEQIDRSLSEQEDACGND
jgi:hypothetical protein